MSSIVILGDGESPQSRANARGRLFEELMTLVIKQLGYEVTEVPRRNYAGMEIDIEATATLGATPLYAECKCYSEPVTAPLYQAFFGKFIGRWHQDKSSKGIFIAIPGGNGAVWAFHRESVEPIDGAVIEIIEQDRVAELVVEAGLVVPGNAIGQGVDAREGTPGDRQLVFTDRGPFWAQLVIAPGMTTPSALVLFDAQGARVTDEPFLETLSRLHPEYEAFRWLTSPAESPPVDTPEEDEAVVEVRGSSTYFEYQFPAAPEFFVGRTPFLAKVDDLAQDVLTRRTSARGILVEAASGWGKSSLILSAVKRLQEQGHYAIAIDSRSASSSQFVLQTMSRLGRDVEGFDELLSAEVLDRTVSGFEGAFHLLCEINEALVAENRLLVIFLDQFENVFFLPDALARTHELFTRLTDLGGNVVVGFAWKTDLVGVMDDFPFEKRNAVRAASRILALPRFGEEETSAMLEELRREMRVSGLRQDLRFLLSDYSQGYPWLLKKLCAHVRAQKFAGVTQADIATSVLNVDELFDEDLQGLSSTEDDVLRGIARLAPILVSELGDDFDPAVVQSLINQRLVVRVANKYDIYWDIFRDYLNTGRLPVQENYILRLTVASVLPRMKKLVELGGSLRIDAFAEHAGLGKQSLYNLLRDLRVLGLVTVDDDTISAQPSFPGGATFDSAIRTFLRDKLVRNRMVLGLLDQLEGKGSLQVEEIAQLLSEMASYVSAADTTWQQYARAMSDWLDFADLAVFNSNAGLLRRVTPGTEVRERSVEPARRRSDLTIPRVQYTPVETAIVRLVDAARARERPEWSGLSASTVRKALGVLNDLGFITSQGASLLLDESAIDFYVADSSRRAKIFAEKALRLRPFAQFVDILKRHADSAPSNRDLGMELSRSLGFEWREGTAETNAKIMLDWARHTELAPPAFAHPRRGKRRREELTLPLADQ